LQSLDFGGWFEVEPILSKLIDPMQTSRVQFSPSDNEAPSLKKDTKDRVWGDGTSVSLSIIVCLPMPLSKWRIGVLGAGGRVTVIMEYSVRAEGYGGYYGVVRWTIFMRHYTLTG
jgi:hypothetical protein